MIRRRDLMKMGLLSTGTFLTMPAASLYGRVSDDFDEEQRSPFLKPFVDPLPTLDKLDSLTRVGPLTNLTRYARAYVGAKTEFYEIAVKERIVKFHRDLPETPVWAYVDANKPPASNRLISFRFPRIELGQGPGGGILVRKHNRLGPRDRSSIDPTREFGLRTLTLHFHGGHQPAAADGFPHDIENGGGPDFPNLPEHVTVHQGESFDYMFPFRDVGFEDGLAAHEKPSDERPSFYWFHDHILDFTGPNVYRGLANLAPAFDRLDSGDETDTRIDPDTGLRALGLPSGPHDIPMVFQDKIFDVTGALIFDPFNGDGFLGDTMLVNGVVQPFHVVERRKYRLRFLNGSNARIYQMFLTNASGQTFPMTQIATEGGLLANSIPNVRNFELYMAQRVEVIVDFADPMFNGESYVYIENRMRQDDGRKPDEVESRGTKLLQFRLSGRVIDTPPVPEKLRPFEPIPQAELAAAERRSFKFDRSGGVFTINNEPIDIDRKNVVPRNVGQVWHFENSSGGWWHPNHVHSEFMRVLARNGRPLTPKDPTSNEADGQARKDTVVMRKNENIDVYIKFRDFSGPFVAHCHNMEHEDHAMMDRFDIEFTGASR
jgi:FtsP/CotA-like multicopper oxidase with cupredoxin domain